MNMKLWIVYNGFLGFGSCKVYVIAETEKRAIEMARDVYKKEVEKMRLNQKLYDYYKKRYYTNLKAELLCDDTTKEWVADEVVDD